MPIFFDFTKVKQIFELRKKSKKNFKSKSLTL